MTTGVDQTLGVVLAGGLSRRMEGPEKSLLSLSGKPLVARVAGRLASQTQTVIINANGDPRRFSFLDYPIVADTVGGHVGPLAGVLAAMRWAQDNASGRTHVLTAASDTPFFPLEYAHTMQVALDTNKADIALACSNSRRHPVFGLWSVELADALEKFLIDEEGRKVMLFVERFSNCGVEFENDGTCDPFFNVNTPEDLAQAEAIALAAGMK